MLAHQIRSQAIQRWIFEENRRLQLQRVAPIDGVAEFGQGDRIETVLAQRRFAVDVSWADFDKCDTSSTSVCFTCSAKPVLSLARLRSCR
jgi:hypothetical protein